VEFSHLGISLGWNAHLSKKSIKFSPAHFKIGGAVYLLLRCVGSTTLPPTIEGVYTSCDIEPVCGWNSWLGEARRVSGRKWIRPKMDSREKKSSLNDDKTSQENPSLKFTAGIGVRHFPKRIVTMNSSNTINMTSACFSDNPRSHHTTTLHRFFSGIYEYFSLAWAKRFSK